MTNPIKSFSLVLYLIVALVVLTLSTPASAVDPTVTINLTSQPAVPYSFVGSDSNTYNFGLGNDLEISSIELLSGQTVVPVGTFNIVKAPVFKAG